MSSHTHRHHSIHDTVTAVMAMIARQMSHPGDEQPYPGYAQQAIEALTQPTLTLGCGEAH